MENSPNRPFWQALVLALLIGGLAYLVAYYAFFKNKPAIPDTTAFPTPSTSVITTPTTSAITPAQTLTITYSSAGFSPSSLTIKTGDTVTWTNQGGPNFFLASDPHPTHTDYAPLNLGIIKDGQSKTLTFPTAGTYKYHNHLNAGQGGTIIVQ